jgi:hypothetical protein
MTRFNIFPDGMRKDHEYPSAWSERTEEAVTQEGR